MKEEVNKFIREWWSTFFFAVVFALAFQDVKMFGWFLAGSLTAEFIGLRK